MLMVRAAYSVRVALPRLLWRKRMRRLHDTQGLCPRCLRRLPAYYEEDDDGAVYLTRSCPEHGTFVAKIWPPRKEAPDIPGFESWRVDKTPSYPDAPETDVADGCPYDCGLCPVHAQHTCHGLLELTMRCNLSCPLCYASSGQGELPADPPRETVSGELRRLLEKSGRCNVQLSGGEPTLRDDLPDIIREAKALDFPLVQVNSNGVRLGREPHYAGMLADAGLDSVYLQWDSLREDHLEILRGTVMPGLREIKEAALENCRRAGLGVVLVATVVKGVNDGDLGDLLRDAVARGPVVRGLHVQPASFFGRTPWGLLGAERFTLGHVMQALASQAPEWISGKDFHPPHCEHSLCSFSAVYARTGDGLKSESGAGGGCGNRPRGPIEASEGSRMTKAFIARQWARPERETSCCGKPGSADAFSSFLMKRREERLFTLSGMAFQDALSLDTERLRYCCLHIVRPDGRIIPFCAQNMTSSDGIPLYPGRLGVPEMK